MVPVPAETDEQMLAALRVAQESASGASNTVTQAALHQLQSSPNITLSGEIAGQQIFVVTDPQQIEALQVTGYYREVNCFSVVLSSFGVHT